jgi:hypothetical protein
MMPDSFFKKASSLIFIVFLLYLKYAV